MSRTYNFRRYFVRTVIVLITFMSVMLLAESGKCQETVSAHKENIFLMSINRPEGSPLYRWVELIYAEVFRRLNIKLEVTYQPLKRASVEANSGKVDGEPARIHAYGASYPNLIRVEEPIFSMSVIAYTADPSISGLSGWESLRNTEYNVGYPHGMKICENNLSKVVKAERLFNVTETVHGLRMAASGRIDLYVDDMNSVNPILYNNEYNLEDKIHVAGIMEEVPLYMYVHKKHRSLIPKLEDAIKEVKSEGLIGKYNKIAFGINND